MTKGFIAAVAAGLLLLAAAPEAKAWGFARSGSFYRSGGSFYHTSNRAAYGPYGEHSSSRTTSYNPYTGFQHSGYGQTSGYGGSAYHSSSMSGYGGAGYGRYSAGAYRRW